MPGPPRTHPPAALAPDIDRALVLHTRACTHTATRALAWQRTWAAAHCAPTECVPQWPVLKGRSNEELLVALKPIKADYVDIRNL